MRPSAPALSPLRRGSRTPGLVHQTQGTSCRARGSGGCRSRRAENQRLSYAQVFAQSVKAAGVYRHVYGVKKGDRVALCARNYPDYLVAFWAFHLIGAVAVLVNAWLPEPALHYCITHTQSKLIILDPERADRLEATAHKIKADVGSTGILVLNSQEGKGAWTGMENWDAVLETYKGDTTSIVTGEGEVEIQPEDNATIMFTSGTTGLPKGVLSTQRMYLTNLFNTVVPGYRASLRRGDHILPAPAAGPQKGSMISVPFFHATGSTSRMMNATLAGMKIVLIRKWVPEEGARAANLTASSSAPGGFRGAGGDIAGCVTGVGVQSVQVNPDAVIDAHAHEGESFRHEAVSAVEVAVLPRDAVRVDVREIGEGVEA
ncbi:putative synthetase [Lyophyllum shimeji]|uniref:Synthetase n=1 Tax=Lyophyllum shimeji TaxID=47721 RepID=A0A9P3UWR8_LYOSH|nr:putative synthetase [Lyophyllum shimeji]